MKVSLELEPPVYNHEAFTSLQLITGVVNLYLWREAAVSKIVLSLQGRLLAALFKATSSGDTNYGAVDNHKLFKLSHDIFPPSTLPPTPKAFTLPKGTHSFPFQIRFPVLATCPKPQPWTTHLRTTLPPSFKFHAPRREAVAKVQYWLRVKVLRPGRFAHRLVAEREVEFVPLDPTMPPPMMGAVRCRSTQVLHSKNSESSTPRAVSSANRQTSSAASVSLAATLPCPAILYPHRPLPLHLFITTHTALPSDDPITLRSLTIALHITTTISIGPDSASWTTTRDLVRITGLALQLHAEEEEEEVSSELWKDAVLRDVGPSFSTCAVTRQHSLVATAGFSRGPREPLYVVSVSLNVEVHSGNAPAALGMGMAVAVVDADAEGEGCGGVEVPVFVPWRVGSERHLGIRRGGGARGKDGAPPPY